MHVEFCMEFCKGLTQLANNRLLVGAKAFA